MGFIAVNNQRQRIYFFGVNQHVQTHETRGLKPQKVIVERGEATANRFEAIKKVHYHFVHRQFIAHRYLAAGELQIFLYAALFNTQGYDVSKMLLGHKNIGLNNRLAHFRDQARVRQLGWVVDVDGFAFVIDNFINHRRRGGDQVEVVFALQALLDDLHVEHAKKATTKAKAQGIRAFWFIEQGGIVKGELGECIAEIFEVVRRDREHTRVNLRFYFLETCQCRHIRRLCVGNGIAHWRALNVFDSSNDKTHFTGFQLFELGRFGTENPNTVNHLSLADGFGDNFIFYP